MLRGCTTYLRTLVQIPTPHRSFRLPSIAPCFRTTICSGAMSTLFPPCRSRFRPPRPSRSSTRIRRPGPDGQRQKWFAILFEKPSAGASVRVNRHGGRADSAGGEVPHHDPQFLGLFFDPEFSRVKPPLRLGVGICVRKQRQQNPVSISLKDASVFTKLHEGHIQLRFRAVFALIK